MAPPEVEQEFDTELEAYMAEWEESLRAKLEGEDGGSEGSSPFEQPAQEGLLEGRWITLSSKDAEGDRHGSTHVYIDDDGTISKGPAHMHGKTVGELSQTHTVTAIHGATHPETDTKAGPSSTPARPARPARAPTAAPPFQHPAGYEPPPGAQPNKAVPAQGRPPLTKAEAEAAQEYSQDAYEPLNSALRSGAELDNPYLADVHQQLQAAFAKARPFARPVKVQRGMELSENQMSRLATFLRTAMASGQLVQIPGYTSTSTSTEVAQGFGQGGVALHIRAAKGLDMSPYTSADSEEEVLLDHNSRFRVKGLRKLASQEKGAPQYVVELEQVLTEEPAVRLGKLEGVVADDSQRDKFVDRDFDHWQLVPDPEAQ